MYNSHRYHHRYLGAAAFLGCGVFVEDETKSGMFGGLGAALGGSLW